ncbi:hypothetical protein PG996_002976 [Apiospora saccharicola]|uniref:Non-reducing end beta-L-arabinofuranosidase-like GH127 middle domain-containing protein n=1 Tax=Apiospora saccharicola TaxID=335842 RepID=A0ABR1W2J4_9PEZI
MVAAASVGALESEGALIPMLFTPLSLGSIKPTGWLQRELQASADGLPGHLWDFYSIVKDSTWLYPPGSGKGHDYSSLNEALPYWFNGIVPLAYTLGNERLKQQVHQAARIILGLQSDDGWFGPEVKGQRNFWGRTPFLLGLTQLAEADTGWVPQIVDALRKFMSLTNSMLLDDGLGYTRCPGNVNCSWGQVRYADFIIITQWLLDNHPSDQDKIIWQNMEMLHGLTPFNWDAWYTEEVYQKVVETPNKSNPLYPFIHGVNIAQGLKTFAVVRRFTHNETLVQTARNAVDWTFKYHSSPSGSILADDYTQDLHPFKGSELCTAVETGYSLAYLYQALGENNYADLAERVYFNALPVMFTTDYWAHQYTDQPNGPWGIEGLGKDVFSSARAGNATIWGLEPQKACCTVNSPQGWAKFVARSWSKIGETGLVHSLLAPSTISTSLGNKPVSVKCETGYPFHNFLNYTIEASQAVDLYIRVPAWYVPDRSSITINGSSVSTLSPDSCTGLHKIPLASGQATVAVTIGADIRIEERENKAVSIYVGNVLYALDVGFDMSPLASVPTQQPRPPQSKDYEIRNSLPWNVAIDPSTLSYRPLIENGVGTGGSVFNYLNAPACISVRGCEIDWPLLSELNGSTTPGSVPTNVICTSGVNEYRLVPLGAAKVHMTELPIVDLAKL